MTKEELKKRIIEVGKKLNKEYLTQRDLVKNGISKYWLNNYYNNMRDLLIDCGLQPSRLAKSMASTNEELLQYLQNLGKQLKKRPATKDIKKEGRYSEVIFHNRFGSIKKAWDIIQKKDEEVGEKKASIESEKGEKRKYTGESAEYLVVSQLLSREYNANILPVDSGIDVFAVRGDRVYKIQVKHTSFNKSGNKTGSVKLTVSSFKKFQASNVFYIIVLERNEREDFLIFPYQKINELITNKIINKEDESSKYTFCIIKKGKKIYVNKKGSKAEVASYYNNWEILV